jgi:selenide,water dikinase
MQHIVQLRKDLVLVGGGHAHALALRMLAMRPVEGLRITLVSPDSHTPYSGMLPGLVAGHYTFEQSHIDLARLCQWAGVRFVAAPVTALDPVTRRLSLAGRPPLDYDVLSLDIGSQPELDSVPGARARAVPVKPVAGLWQRWQALYARVVQYRGPAALRIAIVGGGAGSVELALAMAWRLRGKPVQVHLYCGAREILQGYNSRARRLVMAALGRQCVAVHLDARVSEVDDSGLVFADGGRAVYDELFWCTGAAAAPWIAGSGLPVDAQGFLAVRDTLQSTGTDAVFGAGDIATQVNHPRPKAGVYAVRQGPVLAHNIRALLLERPLREHRPQQRFLSLLSLGDRRAVADRGVFSACGAWVWRWKDSIDRRFMARFSELPRAMSVDNPDRLPELSDVDGQLMCGGCGAKVGADVLGAVLRRLAADFPGYCRGDGNDTATVPGSGEEIVVQSVDVLRAIVQDPWLMGRIAANHALSDLHASGARPVSALAVVTLPFAGGELLERELQQLLAGALHEFSRVGCVLNGGHTLQGPELAIGFVVNGVPRDPVVGVLEKVTGKPGDALVLTRALGTGVLFAAHMQLRADGRDIDTALAAMLQGNADAAEICASFGASACTDVTGFGLLGHLREMLGEQLAARIYLERLPLLPGALALAREGVLSTMHAANLEAAAGAVEFAPRVDHALGQLAFDPQTAGGLLMAVAADRAQECCAALHARGYRDAAVIGELTAAREARDIGPRIQVCQSG